MDSNQGLKQKFRKVLREHRRHFTIEKLPSILSTFMKFNKEWVQSIKSKLDLFKFCFHVIFEFIGHTWGLTRGFFNINVGPSAIKHDFWNDTLFITLPLTSVFCLEMTLSQSLYWETNHKGVFLDLTQLANILWDIL